jgi:hypothetical protein
MAAKKMGKPMVKGAAKGAASPKFGSPAWQAKYGVKRSPKLAKAKRKSM